MILQGFLEFHTLAQVLGTFLAQGAIKVTYVEIYYP